MVDLAGCPNRCRHCWLGAQPNGQLTTDQMRAIAAEFKDWRDSSGRGIRELAFFSWWREPDYCDDYRELWLLEQELSSPGCAQRFELLSTWRLARDPTYASWAATLPPKTCQISFFGMQANTDWGMRRRGAWHDQLLATERCLEVGIAPRWQLFVTKRCLDDLGAFAALVKRLELAERCRAIGQEFVLFMGSITPESSAYALEPLRLEAADLARIPPELEAMCREGLHPLGQPEAVWLPELAADPHPPDIWPPKPALAVNAKLDVYPNVAEPAPWWRLGNLQHDGVAGVMQTYCEEMTEGMRILRELPVSALARRYGQPASTRLYTRSDLIARWLHQWGAEHSTVA